VISVDIDLREWEGVSGRLSDISAHPEKYKLFSGMANLLLRSWWAETFRLGGARRGHQAWVPLNPDYLEWKMRQGKAKTIMQYTGDLLGSINSGDPSTGGIIDRGTSWLVWGTQIPYARHHQEGGTVQGRPPKRELLFITGEDRDEMQRFTASFIDRELGTA